MSMSTPVMQFPENYPEQLEHMGQIIYQELLSMNLPQSQATQKALSMVEALRVGLGGGVFYIPRGLGYQLSLRDEKIWNEFTGNNIPELAIKYELSHMQIRNVLSIARARETAKKQHVLFDESN